MEWRGMREEDMRITWNILNAIILERQKINMQMDVITAMCTGVLHFITSNHRVVFQDISTPFHFSSLHNHFRVIAWAIWYRPSQLPQNSPEEYFLPWSTLYLISDILYHIRCPNKFQDFPLYLLTNRLLNFKFFPCF